MFPHERSLVKRLEGKPFALLGINSDNDRDKTKESVQKEQITWRSWWDGGMTGGPTATAWNVEGWPTLYLIDAKGVIREKWIGSPGEEVLDSAIDDLLEETITGTAPAPKPMPAGIYYLDRGYVGRVDIEGKNQKRFPHPVTGSQAERPFELQSWTARLSPDGRRLAVPANDMNAPRGGPEPWRLYALDLGRQDGAELLTEAQAFLHPAAWSADGSRLVCNTLEKGGWQTWVLDLKTKKISEKKLPRLNNPSLAEGTTLRVKDWSTDGEWFLATGDGLHILKTDGTELKTLAGPAFRVFGSCCRFSPDGRQALFDAPRADGGVVLFSVDIASSKTRKIVDIPDASETHLFAAWSPDGKRVAYSYGVVGTDKKPVGETRLCVVDANGEKPSIIVSEKHDPRSLRMQLLCWR